MRANIYNFKKLSMLCTLMKSLEDLNKEASEIHLKIRRLVLNKDCFKEGLSEKIAVVATITTLREELVKIQREIWERSPENRL